MKKQPKLITIQVFEGSIVILPLDIKKIKNSEFKEGGVRITNNSKLSDLNLAEMIHEALMDSKYKSSLDDIVIIDKILDKYR